MEETVKTMQKKEKIKIVKWCKDITWSLVENLPEEQKKILYTINPNFKKKGLVTIAKETEIEDVSGSPTEHIRKLAKREGIDLSKAFKRRADD